MNNIETIYFTATTTNADLSVSTTTAEFTSPFLIFVYIFMIMLTTMLAIGLYKFFKKK
jgi:hypothetical protein